jgi:hypothetical protein
MNPEPFGADGHEPDRATWNCTHCETAWPCDPAREALRSTLDAIQLATHMMDALTAAVPASVTRSHPSASCLAAS